MLSGIRKTVIMDVKHYRIVKRLAKRNHMAIYAVIHEIVDQHCERMNRLEELKETT